MKKKFLMILLAIGFVLPCGLFLVACGSTPDEKVATSLSVEISETSQYYQYYDGQCLNLTKDERNFTKDDFVVTIYYSDNSKEITQNYNFNADEELSVYDGTTNYYNIYFYMNGQQFATIMVKVEKLNEELPTLTGLRKDGDAFYLEQELRYNGEEQSAIDYIGTSEDGVTLKSLIDENKVSISLGETISATDANDFYDSEYSYNTFILSANDGYTWKDNETEIKNIRIKWQIKRKILETPTVTSGVEFEYAYQMDNGNLEGVERGLTFDYKGNESLINDNNVKLSYAGEHSWRLELYDSDNYAFLNGEQETNYLDYTWKITPKKLNINDVLIDDNSHFNGTDYRYTYTGQEIKPNLNISADCPVFYINYGNSGEASDNAYNIAVSVNTNLFSIPETSVLNNFVWANGDKIDINYSKNLEFYIDKAQVVAPNGFDEISIKFNSQAYSADGNTLYDFNLTNDSSSSFTTETLNALNELQMFDNSTGAGFEWEDGNQSLTVETNKAVLYWFSSRTGNYTNNYIPLTINVSVEITKAKAVLDPSWSQNSDTNEWTIQSLNNDDVNAVIDYITYKTYYSETGYSTSNEAENLTDAGYYTTIATLPENANYEYYLNEDGEAITTLSKQWSIDKTNIDLGYYTTAWSLSDGTNTSSQLDSYYYENDGVAVSKNVTFDSSTLSQDAQNIFDVSVSHYISQSEGWIEATNCTEVGVYKSVATLTFKDGYKAKNYVVNYGAFNTDDVIQISVDWAIYPNSYTLTTTDATSENYIGWPTDVKTAFVYKGEYQNQQPEAIVPDGLYISYNWSNIDDIYSTDNRGRSGIGTYRIYANLNVQTGLLGFNNVTVTVDGKKYLENAERIFYSSITGEEESRGNISIYNGIFYTGIDDLDYIIYEKNFFAGKTFTFDSVVVSAVDGSNASEEAKAKASQLKTDNANKTMSFANSGNLVSGTCNFGEGSLNVLSASYSENEGKVTVSFSSSKSLVGTMIYDNTLVLTENDGTHIWTYTFKLPTVV